MRSDRLGSREIGAVRDIFRDTIRELPTHRIQSRIIGSVAGGSAAWKDSQHLDDASSAIADEAHPPVADPKAPLIIAAGELDDVAPGRLVSEAIQRIGNAALNRWV